jgi:hypothetical protein
MSSMNVKWDDVKNDYKKKDERIAELEAGLSHALWGWSNGEPMFIVKGQHWTEYLNPRVKNGLTEMLRDRGVDLDLDVYGSLVDVVDEIIGL